jgi:hypothetical protein
MTYLPMIAEHETLLSGDVLHNSPEYVAAFYESVAADDEFIRYHTDSSALYAYTAERLAEREERRQFRNTLEV